MDEKEKHKIEVEEDHGFFHFFLDLFKGRKKKRKGKGKYHGFMSKKVYLAFKEQWGKPHRKKEKKKVSIEFETAKELKEAAKTIKEMKRSAGTRAVFEQIRYVESLDDKIERVKQMLKHLEYEYLKRHINQEEYNRRKFEYMEALRYLQVQKKIKQKPTKPGAKPRPGARAAVSGTAVRPAGIEMPEPITPRAPRIRPVARPLPGKPRPEISPETGKKIVETLEKIEGKLPEKVAAPEAAGEKPGAVEKPERAAVGEKAIEKRPEAPERKPEIAARPTVAKKPEKEARLFKFRPREITGTKRAKPRALPKKPGKAPFIETPIDNFVKIIQKNKKLSFKNIANMLGWSVESVERVGLVLEKQGIVDVHYPTVVTAKPSISFVKELPSVPRYDVLGELLEEYSFAVDFVPAAVRIYRVKEEQRPVYHLITPYVGAYTMAFFEELKEDIAEQIPVEAAEISDPKKSKQLKEKFFTIARKELKRYFGEGQSQAVDVLAGLLLHAMYGLGLIEILMGDNQLEEVAINSSKSPITVYQRKYGWMQTTVFMKSEEEILNYSAQVGRKVGREITTLNPILDAHLASGDRVSATLSPVSTFGNTITIRRFARRPWTIVDFIGKGHTMNIEMASILWLAMQYEMSVIVAGGTASGKTSCLNALLAMVPAYHRVISIEDVREIMLPKYMHWNWVPMTTRNPNPEGLGEVSMLDLMQSSLRMRPDRIILGEIRRKKEAEVLFEAMHTGHSVYSTLHANNAQQVLRRLTEPPIALPPLEIEAIDLLLVQYRDRRKNIRRTYEISELESGVSGEQLSLNTVFRWDPRMDSWEAVNPATKLIRQLNLHTGMTEDEIMKDLEDRATVLQWMLENNLNDINKVGLVMKAFYSKPKSVIEAAEKNLDPKAMLEEKK